MGGSNDNVQQDLQEFVHFNYVNQKDIQDDLKCGVCKNVLSHPKMLQCGDVFCNNCISKSQESKCPTCLSDSVTALPAPRILVNMLNGLQVSCLTCTKVLSRNNMDDHYWNTCEITCPHGCGATMMRSALKQHEQQQCPNRPTKCSAFDVGCPHVCAPHLVAAHVASCAYVQLRPVLQKMQAEIVELKQFVAQYKAKKDEKERKRRERPTLTINGPYLVSNVPVAQNTYESLIDKSSLTGVAANSPGWIQLTYAEPQEFSRCRVMGFYGNTSQWAGSNGSNAALEYSTDGVTWIKIGTIPSLTQAEQVIPFSKTKARYWRANHNSYMGLSCFSFE